MNTGLEGALVLLLTATAGIIIFIIVSIRSWIDRRKPLATLLQEHYRLVAVYQERCVVLRKAIQVLKLYGVNEVPLADEITSRVTTLQDALRSVELALLRISNHRQRYAANIKGRGSVMAHGAFDDQWRVFVQEADEAIACADNSMINYYRYAAIVGATEALLLPNSAAGV